VKYYQNVYNLLVTTFKLFSVPKTPYWGSAPRPRWGTPVPQTPVVLLPHPNAPSAAFGLALISVHCDMKIDTEFDSQSKHFNPVSTSCLQNKTFSFSVLTCVV